MKISLLPHLAHQVRNILEPFGVDNYQEAWRNIQSNWIKKYNGERI